MVKKIWILLIAVFLFSCNDKKEEPVPENPPEEQNPDENGNEEEGKGEEENNNPTPEGLTYVFDIESLPEITVNISEEEWNKLLSYFDQNPNNEEYVKADFSFEKEKDKISLSEIGFRLRGNTSRRRPEGWNGEKHNPQNPDWHHAHFALNFKKYIKGQKMAGMEKINLKWFKDDPCYVREVYCYDLFEKYGVWTAPQSSYCKLNIKVGDGETAYFGVYQMVEPIDKEFLKRRIGKFPDSDGFLWKANWGAGLNDANRSLAGLENITLTETHKPVYDLKTNEKNFDYATDILMDFIKNLNAKNGNDFKTWIGNAMDIELFLKTYAVNVVCGMWDDYWTNTNNFYFYFDSSGKFYFIPYDYDNTLGTSLIMNDSGTQDLLNWGNNNNPLVYKILSVPEYKTLYIKYINELCSADNDYFYADKSIARITKWQNMIRPYVDNDTNEDTQIADQPASWGNCGFYRLMQKGNNNYFVVRAKNIP